VLNAVPPLHDMANSDIETTAKKGKLNYCGSCGNAWNPQWKFCKFCGSSLQEKSQPQKSVKPNLKSVAVPRENKILNKWFLKIDSVETAKKAVAQAYVVAYIIAGITMLFALISLVTEEAIGGIDAWAIVDALLFALVGLGLQFYLRSAAVIGLALFVLEKIYMIAEGNMSVVGFFITLAFIVGLINGARGTYAYHHFRNLKHATTH